VDEGGRLQGLARLFLCKFLRRKLAQLVVNQRQKLVGGVRIALLHGGQDAGNVAHEANDNRRQSTLEATT
jgi:hypothetical protein